MAYPVFYPFKTRVLNAVSSSSNGFMSVGVPARCKYVGGYYTPTQLTAHTQVTNACEVVAFSQAASGSFTTTIISSGTATAVVTTTGTDSTPIPITASTVTYLAAGDVLSVQLSSCTGGNMSFVVQEF